MNKVSSHSWIFSTISLLLAFILYVIPEEAMMPKPFAKKVLLTNIEGLHKS